MLITYGDLILSTGRNPLETLADFSHVVFGDLVTALHILPFFPYSSDRGFAVVSYEEVDPELGNWEDVARLKSNFKLMFDGVVNHVSSKSRWFREFLNGNPNYDDYFIVFDAEEDLDYEHRRLILRPRTSDLLTQYRTINGSRYLWTTFSADQIDLNYQNFKVLLRIIETLLFYVRQGADLLRLDAVTYLWYELGTSGAHLEQTHEIIKLLREILDICAPHVAIVTETNVPHAQNVTYFGNGNDEAQLVYNFALPPLVLHSFYTGNTTTLSEWAARLDPPSETTSFLNFLDSHDGIGLMGAREILSEQAIQGLCARVKKNGGFVSMKQEGDGSQSPYELNTTWFDALMNPGINEPVALKVDRFVASRAIALVLRGLPAIYLPSMFGSRNDLDAVKQKESLREISRSAFVEEKLFRAFGDPESVQYKIADRIRGLLAIRASESAYHPNSPQTVLLLNEGLFSVLRGRGHDSILSLINVTANELEVQFSIRDLGFQCEGFFELLSGQRVGPEGQKWLVKLRPYQVAFFKAHPTSD
jgi:sucrose phosphorylase